MKTHLRCRSFQDFCGFLKNSNGLSTQTAKQNMTKDVSPRTSWIAGLQNFCRSPVWSCGLGSYGSLGSLEAAPEFQPSCATITRKLFQKLHKHMIRFWPQPLHPRMVWSPQPPPPCDGGVGGPPPPLWCRVGGWGVLW